MTATKKNPGDGRLFAIGDIHGCVDELAALIKAIAPATGDTVVFVGDYIDRGPGSSEVIDFMLELPRGGAECIFLKGNHEDMMLSFLGFQGRYGDSFLLNGGAQTLESYHIDPERTENPIERIPPAHIEFFKNLATSYRRPPYLFVHAGISPTRQLEEQSVEDMLWIRQEFIFHPHKLGDMVVFGHTPMRAVMTDPPYKLGIDTGLVYGGKLTCINFTERAAYQIGRGSRQVKKQQLDLG
ncbi:MAG TPA: metallophosphoesterase family protein [Candidatus Binataceae bacterium]|nr:metallophosphoesterase family protein [Candidatus Binataceae bacterium]